MCGTVQQLHRHWLMMNSSKRLIRNNDSRKCHVFSLFGRNRYLQLILHCEVVCNLVSRILDKNIVTNP